jgi:hypothetical protein
MTARRRASNRLEWLCRRHLRLFPMREVRLNVPVFAYRGLTPDGRSVRGVVPADSARGARARLRRDGIFPTEVAEEHAPERGGVRAWRRGGSVRPGDLAVVSRQLATLLAAGMPVVEALGAVSEQTERPALARTLSLVRDGVTQGAALADALAEHEDVFHRSTSAWCAPAKPRARSTWSCSDSRTTPRRRRACAPRCARHSRTRSS